MNEKCHSIQFVSPPAAKVSLVSYTNEPLATIAKIARTFEHRLDISPADPGEIDFCIKQLMKTALRGPLEMVGFVWLIENVTRAMTHQLVRYRVGISFIQESLRFSQQKQAKVLLPDFTNLLDEQRYKYTACCSVEAYWALLNSGVETQVARGLLPIHILTNIWVGCSLRTLIHIFEQRACSQAQKGEWNEVLSQMLEQLVRIDSRFKEMFQLPCERDGICPFRSVWDRPCEIRERLDAL